MTLSLPNLLRLPILNRLARHPKSLDPRRHTAVTRRLQNHLPDLLFSAAIVQSTFDVGRKLGATILAT